MWHLVVLTREGMGMWVVVVGACVMEVGIKADNDIGHRLGVLVTWEVLALSMMAVVGGCCRCRGGDMAHRCHVGVVAGCVAWQSMWGPTHRLAHGGHSRHVVAVTNGGNGLDGW